MKHLVLILFFFPTLLYAQVKTEFYVDDVKDIEYLTLSFCVDSMGKVNNINTILEKTTYKNLENIDKTIQYLKGFQYSSNGKSIGCQYSYTFQYINSKYENKILTESEYKKCQIFKKGKYKYLHPSYSNTKIIRKNKTQIEKGSGNGKSVYKLEWQSPCKYSLTHLKVEKEKYKYLLGETINVEIIAVLDNNRYIYRGNLLDRTKVIGIIKKIN